MNMNGPPAGLIHRSSFIVIVRGKHGTEQPQTEKKARVTPRSAWPRSGSGTAIPPGAREGAEVALRLLRMQRLRRRPDALHRRSERGFTNIFKKEQPCEPSDLERFDNGATVDEAACAKAGWSGKERRNQVSATASSPRSSPSTRKSRVGAEQIEAAGAPARRSRKLNLLETLRNIWAIEDLRKRCAVHVWLLAVYRSDRTFRRRASIRSRSPSLQGDAGGGSASSTSLGGRLRRLSVFALGIHAVHLASIILQLSRSSGRTREALEGRGDGAAQDNHNTRYGTVALSSSKSLGVAFWSRVKTRPRRTAGAARVQDALWGVGASLMTISP